MPLLRCSRQARYGKQHCGFKSTYPYSIAYYLYENVVYNEMIRMLSDKTLRPVEEQELNAIEHKLNTAHRKANKLKSKILDLELEDDDEALTDLYSDLKKKIKKLTTRKQQIEKNLQDRPTYISDDIRKLEQNAKELNLNFNQLQKKMIIKDKTISFEGEQRYKVTYDGYSQRDKGYQITRNFLIFPKDLTNPVVIEKYVDTYISKSKTDDEQAYYDYLESRTHQPCQDVNVTEFLKTTDICRKVK